MIDVKVIKKPKNEGSTSAISSGSTAYAGMAVKEAAHAAKADIAELAKEAQHATLADVATNSGNATHADEADHATEADHALEADHAKEADNADKWDGKEFADYLDQPVRESDHVKFAEVITDVVRSAGTFVDGVIGEGFKLWRDEKGLTYLCLDKLTVRQTMTVMELLIEKVRAIGGTLVVSAANGRIKEVVDEGEDYYLTFEQENTFVAGDLMRCQTWSGNDIKSYWVEIAEADSDGVRVAKSEFTTSEPAEGDECVLMGNTTNKNRQNMILISATEDGQPRVDVMDGVSDKHFTNALRVRLGNLDGINDDAFPADNQPTGNGLYADNVFLKGTFLLQTGEDIKTKFEITEGKIESAIEGLRQDFVSDKGFLNNSTFYDGMAKWNTTNKAVFFLAGNRWIWANKNVLTKKGECAGVTKDNGRTVVLIRNKYIQQKNSNLRTIPTFETNSDGLKEAVPVYLSFFYKCKSDGRLTVEFENVDKTGFKEFDSMHVEEDMTASDEYNQYTCNGLWNGTGDFTLSFTGEIYVYMLVLSTDKVESLTYKYKTLFEQSERLIKLTAAVFDKDENALQETGLMIRPEGSGIYMQTADGNLALIGVAVEQDGKTLVKLTGDNILLEGAVTANGNFKILEDGSIVAVNGTFTGKVNADSGRIGNFIISDGHLGVGVRTVNEDGEETYTDDTNGLFLYDDAIGFNAKNRQAIFGTWNTLGQPMLTRLVDTATDMELSDGTKVGILPKYGIVFDIENAMDNRNFAFVGKGHGVLNGYIDGYAYKKVSVSKANTAYDVGVSEGNRLIVNCSVSNSGICLPRLTSMRNALAIGKTTPFAFRLTIISDLGSSNFNVYGRNTNKDSNNATPWNSEDYPLFTNQNGGQTTSLEMGQGDSIEVLLVFDPDRTDTISDFTTNYTARIINKLS